MTVRGAKYKRVKNDYYPTPPEVTHALFRNCRLGPTIFDPACGKSKAIIKVAQQMGFNAYGHDIATDKRDFLAYPHNLERGVDIVTNPPYGAQGRLAVKFIERALASAAKHHRTVAMLLPMDFDCAKTRQHLFRNCFREKIVLLDRIKWFNNQAGSTNHAWYVWYQHDDTGLPVIKYTKVYSVLHPR